MDYKGLKLEIFPTVYEPAEDSLLLAKYSEKMKGVILDIGCGCGIQALINAKNNPENRVYGVDINLEAVRNADHNKQINGIRNAKFLSSDLFSSFIIGQDFFDGIIFNPPYLPTTKEEKISDELNYAFDGGEDGRVTLNRFFEQFIPFLKPTGQLLLLQSSLNGLEETTRKLEGIGLQTEILDEEKFFFEKIFVIQAKYPQEI